MGFVVMVVVFVQHGQVDQRIEMHRRAGADALVQLDRLGVFGAAVVQHRQAKAGLFVVGIFSEGPLVKFGGLFVQAVRLGLLPTSKEFFTRFFVDGRDRKIVHSGLIRCCVTMPRPARDPQPAINKTGTNGQTTTFICKSTRSRPRAAIAGRGGVCPNCWVPAHRDW